jgi:hypothetical protein
VIHADEAPGWNELLAEIGAQVDTEDSEGAELRAN